MEGPEIVLKVGKKGEIYTTKKIREKLGIKKGGLVRAIIDRGRLILEPIPPLEEIIKNGIVELTPEEAEKLSQETQKKKGAYG